MNRFSYFPFPEFGGHGEILQLVQSDRTKPHVLSSTYPAIANEGQRVL